MAYVTCLECGASVHESDRFRCPECGHSAYPCRCVACLYCTHYDEDGSYSCSFGVRISGYEGACVHYVYDDD